MSENLRQSLSALVDGEADELELRRVLGDIDKDGSEEGGNLRECWSRYQVARSAMKNDLPLQFNCVDLSGRISAVIDEESFDSVSNEVEVPGTKGDESKRLPSWFKPVGGIAVAASVALITVFGVGQYESSVVPGQVAPANNPVVASVVPSKSSSLSHVSAGGAESFAMPANYSRQKVTLAEGIQQAKQSQVIAHQRLDAYLLKHAEHAALNNSQGMMPLARVAHFE